MQTGLIGLKAEAIGKKKWGIATDRFKKIKIRALGFWFMLSWLLLTGLLVPQG
jgi:hypothetical protein